MTLSEVDGVCAVHNIGVNESLLLSMVSWRESYASSKKITSNGTALFPVEMYESFHSDISVGSWRLQASARPGA